jgi:5-methylcytosine-specific restriction endonuclease McrA
MKLPWIVYANTREDKTPFYHTRQWRRIRQQHIEANPLCVHCLEKGIYKDCTGKGEGVVDHIKPIKKGGGATDTNNLQTLCNRCHNSKSAKDK